jgi:ATP adenylyltransferase
MAYITGLKGHVEGRCLFCVLREREPDVRSLILTRREHTYLMLNAFPYNTGHLMVVPYRHVRGPGLLGAEEAAEFMALAAVGEDALRRAYRPHGFNMGINLGRTSGAGVVGHLHLHIVPRWNGDTNFMPVVGGTKVLPESLATTYERLLAALVSDSPNERPRRAAHSAGARRPSTPRRTRPRAPRRARAAVQSRER